MTGLMNLIIYKSSTCYFSLTNFFYNYFFAEARLWSVRRDGCVSAANRRLVPRLGGQRGGAGPRSDVPQAADADVLGNAPVAQPREAVDAPHVEVAVRPIRRNPVRQLRRVNTLPVVTLWWLSW